MTVSRRPHPELSAARHDSQVRLRFVGPWTLGASMPAAHTYELPFTTDGIAHVSFDTSKLTEWDTGFITYLVELLAAAGRHHLDVDRGGLPQGVQRLLALVEAVPEKADARHDAGRVGMFTAIGRRVIDSADSARAVLGFIGEATLAFGKLLAFRARYRTSDLLLLVQQAGAEALPIVTLISFLVGLILAFVGAVQLQQFGATIYVANLVGIATVREMGAMMTAIVMAGRTGAAYAAQLGSMKATQELDALTTMGISPLEFLVLPRMIALFLMMPLLCLYSDLLGILGGATVSVGLLGLSPIRYYQQTVSAISLGDLVGGVFKASVYGVLIALAGCLRGIQAGKSSAAVGEATTSAVVTSIVWIITACGIFAVLFYLLGI